MRARYAYTARMAKNKPARKKRPPTIPVYQPEAVPDLFARVRAAADEQGKREARDVSLSEWLIRAAIDRLDREHPKGRKRDTDK